ncbi:hypothetical protein ACHAXT_002500 [Thalassiosira profunda]
MTAPNLQTLAAAAVLLLHIASHVQADRVVFDDGSAHDIDRDYEEHNLFVANGTTVFLEGGHTIAAPGSSDDGEDAIRVEDSSLRAFLGKIYGGHDVGGTGVTISTTRDAPPGTTYFKWGIEVSGGDATRNETTRGGDAVQVLQSGSKAFFEGGRFVPGYGCDASVCGPNKDDGVALRVIQGEAIVSGGSFEGAVHNVDGTIEVQGCGLEYDEELGTITGFLTDGSEIDVEYQQPSGQIIPPVIRNFDDKACSLPEPEGPSPAPGNGGGKTRRGACWMGLNLVLGLPLVLP